MEKRDLVNFLLGYENLSWNLSASAEEILYKAIDEFFENYESQNCNYWEGNEFNEKTNFGFKIFLSEEDARNWVKLNPENRLCRKYR